jgi:hypothetical protein
MPRFYDTCAGTIRGLYLPPVAWAMLQREKIQTLEQLVVRWLGLSEQRLRLAKWSVCWGYAAASCGSGIK